MYNNEAVKEDNPTAVMEHGDPGLLSISFISSEPGLLMFDNISKNWIPVPSNTAVLWYQ